MKLVRKNRMKPQRWKKGPFLTGLPFSIVLSLYSCSPTSVPCADYFPTYLDVATTMQNETNTRFASVWVDDNSRLATRFFVPSRLPFVIYAKDGECKSHETLFGLNFDDQKRSEVSNALFLLLFFFFPVRQIPYNRNETQFLIDFIEEEQYKNYPIMSGPMSPTSTL